ncbi:MAG: exonuclease SbcCD subunit D [Nitrososphaeria archaeon]|nr:exonuclease SbcCD subunit D [Nitrososphaeria archaeon]NDB51281.1 exonuclease SbcCD subunit D [Nitrosopumilaceae archaeon]NDB88093.1 exonuclease SbcCD subunit D [Nitrososphaerota archaeon]NDB62919.1 exonuclease SbcCD subunit D [Nitrosopumilaceae archaeon]NDB89823.1 exonuclease SbcCD subunit D [Nitrososphaerota archaeon]
MIFSHISDTHLGLTQYGLQEREDDVYSVFNESIETSIKDHVDFVIFAGDIFHVPNPSGTAILQMANALKRLKQEGIDSFFVLGEHDISRVRSAPIPYVYHNLGFSKYVGQGKPVIHKGVLIAGFDKIRRGEMSQYLEKFAEIDKIAAQHSGHKILVMHQGIAEINQYAGELASTDLPKNFTYYAMGHLHDKFLKQFSHLGGPVAYPGSIEMTTSEGIKETQKGFYEVDISSSEAKPNWIKLDTRPQFSDKIEYQSLSESITKVLEKISGYAKKPIVELKIHGKEIESEIIQTQISRLAPYTLHYTWKIVQEDESNGMVMLERPSSIDDELFKLASNYLGTNEKAAFAIQELLPLLSTNKIKEAEQAILEEFERFKK